MAEARSEHVGLTALHLDRMVESRFEHVGLTTLHESFHLLGLSQQVYQRCSTYSRLCSAACFSNDAVGKALITSLLL